MKVLRSADLAPTVHGERIERTTVHRIARGRVAGIASLIAIYGIAVYASIGLVHQPSGSGSYVASMLLGALNMLVLPLLVLAAVAGVRRMWRDGATSRGIARLLTAPLWASFMVALLTVPLWIGMANAGRQAQEHATLDSSVTFLLAPWGFLLAYGCSLFIICAMYDFTFPVVPDESPVTSAALPD